MSKTEENRRSEQTSTYVPLCTRDEAIYTSCYCEENIWKLVELIYNKHPRLLDDIGLDRIYAVFISNKSRMIPLFCQSKAPKPSEPLVWDYHVILVHKTIQNSSIDAYVYDFDTTFEFPCKFTKYMKYAVNDDKLFQSKFHRLFKVISGKYYLEQFASSRVHMLKDKEKNEYHSPPPPYPCIRGKLCRNDEDNNIQEFINMMPVEDRSDGNGDDSGRQHGKIMNLKEFINYMILTSS